MGFGFLLKKRVGIWNRDWLGRLWELLIGEPKSVEIMVLSGFFMPINRRRLLAPKVAFVFGFPNP